MEGNVLHVVSPYQKRTPTGAPSKVVVPGKSANEHSVKIERGVGSPCVLDHEAQIVFPGKFHSFLDVFRRPRVDSDDRHAPLSTRNAERGVEIASLDRPVGRGPRLPIGVLSGPGLIRTPDTVVPADKDISAVSCSRVIARSCWRDRVDQWLRDC